MYAQRRTHTSKGTDTTDGPTEQRTLPLGAFLATRLDHDDRTLQLADWALHDGFRIQWPLQSLCWGRVKRIGCPRLCGTDLPPGNGLFVFSLVVIPTLLFMGLITFERVLQAGSADIVYARGINRIRHLYLEYAPQMQPYFILSTYDDQEGTLGQEAMQTSWWQVFLSMAGMIAVINSVLAGSFVGLLLAAFTLPLWVTTSAGVVTFLVSVGLHQRYQWRQWMRLGRNLPVLFPSQPR